MYIKRELVIPDYNENLYYKNNPQYFLELLTLAKRGKCTKSLLSNCSRKEYKNYSYLKQWIDCIIPDCIKDEKYNYNTKVHWVLFGLINFPVCKKCGLPIKRNVFLINEPRYNYCNRECQLHDKSTRDKAWKTCFSHFGVEYPAQSKQVLKTRKQNNIKKYGVSDPNMLTSIKEKIKSHRLKKFNGKWESEETLSKRQSTNLDRYGHICSAHGVEQENLTRISWRKYKNNSPLSDPEIREKSKHTCLQKYGCEYFAQSKKSKLLWSDPEWRHKTLKQQFETKQKNRSFHTSKAEQIAFNMLKRKYGNEVVSQFKSEAYPFACDFYIKHLDLYIECNFHWTHGGHWFDENDSNDVNRLLQWKSKNTKYYNNAITTWTVRDLLKRKYALANHLNFKVYWTFEEFKNDYD